MAMQTLTAALALAHLHPHSIFLHPPLTHSLSPWLAPPPSFPLEYKISRFGRAAMQSGVSPDEAIMLYEDLNMALGGVNLETDLHLVYLVTPQDRGLYPDFQVRFLYRSLYAPRAFSSICCFTGYKRALPSSQSCGQYSSQELLSDVCTYGQKLLKLYTQSQGRPVNKDRSVWALCESAGVTEMLLVKVIGACCAVLVLLCLVFCCVM